MSLLQTASDCLFLPDYSAASLKHLAGEEKQSEEISQMAREHMATGSGSFLPVLQRWTCSESLLTQQLRLVVSSRALKDNTDEKVALLSATDHPPTPTHPLSCTQVFLAARREMKFNIASAGLSGIISDSPAWICNEIIVWSRRRGGEQRSNCPLTGKIPNICHVIRCVLTILQWVAQQVRGQQSGHSEWDPCSTQTRVFLESKVKLKEKR